jgi:RNA polymerase sigma factor (sigma-70 family)
VDGDTFSDLYVSCRGEVFRYLLKRVFPDTGLADDLTSETFCRAWAYWPRYKDTGNPAHWLYRIARSVLIDRIRQHEAPVSTLLERACDWSQSEFAKVEDDDWCGQLLSELTAAQREIIRLSQEGYPPSVISRMLGRSELSVRQMKLRALRSLKRHMEEVEL